MLVKGATDHLGLLLLPYTMCDKAIGDVINNPWHKPIAFIQVVEMNLKFQFHKI